MLANTDGLVTRSIKYGETSLIFDVYTRQWGMRTYIAHGVRQEKPRFSQLLLRPNALIDMVVFHVADKDINHIKEVKPTYIYQKLPFSVKHGAVAMLICELLQKCLRDADANEELYLFLAKTFQLLDSFEQVPTAFHLAFMSQLSFYLGFAPQVSSFAADTVFDYKNGVFILPNSGEHLQHFDAESSQYLVDIYCTPLAEIAALSIPAQARPILYKNLLGFYSYHVSGLVELQSYTVLRGIF